MLTIHVKGNKGSYTFVAEFHQSNSRFDYRIDSRFYTENGQLFDGAHVEIELHKIPSFERTETAHLHVHVNPDNGKKFVCWIYQQSDLAEAESLFKWWCVGSVYTIEHGADFGPVLEKHKDTDDFVAEMSSLGIQIQ